MILWRKIKNINIFIWMDRPSCWKIIFRYAQNRARLQEIDRGWQDCNWSMVCIKMSLTSSESNVRNLQMGYKLAQEFGGKWTKTGYFPDSFGNVGQAPQLLKKAGIDTAVFGRGVKPTGFNNQTADAYESAYSEMNWQSADGYCGAWHFICKLVQQRRRSAGGRRKVKSVLG